MEGVKSELLTHPDVSGLDCIRANEIKLSYSATLDSSPNQSAISASMIVVSSTSADYEDIGNRIKGIVMNRAGPQAK